MFHFQERNYLESELKLYWVLLPIVGFFIYFALKFLLGFGSVQLGMIP